MSCVRRFSVVLFSTGVSSFRGHARSYSDGHFGQITHSVDVCFGGMPSSALSLEPKSLSAFSFALKALDATLLNYIID